MTGTAGIRSAAICLALASGVTVAAPASPEIAGMISRLGNESFSERERASTEILAHAKKHSAEVEKSLVEGFRRSPEPEVRFRCKSILMKFYAESVGYVGVYYQNREFVNKQGERQLVVGISQIAPGSPAAQAKLQPGDVILSVNGQPVDPLEPSLDFAKRIQMLGSGRTVTLKLARAMEEIDVKVALGQRPLPLTDKEAEALFKARIQKAERELEK
jgi:C-terminal processing protease CtpA/Prc